MILAVSDAKLPTVYMALEGICRLVRLDWLWCCDIVSLLFSNSLFKFLRDSYHLATIKGHACDLGCFILRLQTGERQLSAKAFGADLIPTWQRDQTGVILGLESEVAAGARY